MNNIVLLLFACFVIAYSQVPPPPRTWPPVWHTWVVTTVMQENSTTPIYNKGQLIAYDLVNNYTCRYNQQNLLNLTAVRGLDVCNYYYGQKWEMLDTLPTSNCSSTTPIGGTLPRLYWPDEFLQNAKWISVDKVNQRDCNHWVALNIVINNQTVQMDVWTSVGDGMFCQISIFDTTDGLHTTWAFDGFNTKIPLEATYACEAGEIMCKEENWVCNVKPNTTDAQMIAALSWVCNPIYLDCSPINPGGPYYYPNTLIAHSNWAFNAYYDKNRIKGGFSACDFGGIAQVVPPTNTNKHLHPKLHEKPFTSLFKIAKRNVQQPSTDIFYNDLVCADS